MGKPRGAFDIKRCWMLPKLGQGAEFKNLCRHAKFPPSKYIKFPDAYEAYFIKKFRFSQRYSNIIHEKLYVGNYYVCSIRLLNKFQ